MAKRPNVVLICVDQWRGDCLSVAGHPVVQTPYLDKLALDGVRFERAYSATPTCIPARAALYTGLSQKTHGRIGYQDGMPWNYPCTMAGEFTAGGYQTQAIGKLHVFPERSQMGFQNVILHDGYLHFVRKKDEWGQVDDYIPWLRERDVAGADYFEHGVNCNSIVARPWDKAERLHPTNFIVSQSVAFLRRRDPGKPFFLFMSFHRPHPPYDPPAWAFEQYINRQMPEPPRGDWLDLYAAHADPRRPDCLVGRVDPHALQRARAGYYGHMSHIDHQINRFMETLAERNLLDDTWVCFTSDHGEMLGDHDLFRKGFPYEGSAHVPLILRGPKDSGLKVRSALRPVVELRDIMPTLLECAGLPVPKHVEGLSFLGLARGERSTWRPYLHGEHTLLGQDIHWLTDEREKYVWFSGSGKEQLFDLQRDPQETTDLARKPEQASRLDRWRKALMGELAGREEGFTDGQRLVPARPVQNCLAHLRKEAGQA